MADVDKRSSKVVMVYKAGQLLNDTRMFINFGELARIKGYAPNNCTYDLSKNVDILYKDKSGTIILEDSGSKNYNNAKIKA
jgi:hypothetical protein